MRKRVDERDIMFARMGYQPGSDQYTDYYAKHPELEEIDQKLRDMPELCTPGTPTYDPYLAPAVDANFTMLSHIRHLSDGPVNETRTEITAEDASQIIQQMALHYGASDVGFTPVDASFYYSHRGRHPENYGDVVEETHPYAIVFLVAMDQDVINSAPSMSACVEVTKAYMDAAIIGMQLAYYIRQLGYPARCHMDGNYLMPLIPVAVEAGIGEIGRHGLLISRKKGVCVRLGAVTTDMPLIASAKKPLDISRFCRLCKMCARTCPAKTITLSDDTADWSIDQEKCYKIWRSLGTDCGICLSACPIAQGIAPEAISTMSDDDINAFIQQYRDENGHRKRNRNKLFIKD